MTKPLLACGLLLLASVPATAQKCAAIDITMLNKGFADVAPWRVMSGGPGQCSFTTRNSSVNLGFSHMVMQSREAADASTAQAI